MGWFNYYGLVIVATLLAPNIVYASKNKEGFVNLYQNKVVLCLEQVGRFGCFLLMIFNIPHLYDEFWFENGLTVYLICKEFCSHCICSDGLFAANCLFLRPLFCRCCRR